MLSYTNLGLLGIPKEGNNRQVADQVLLDAFLEVLGQPGTLCVPTYTYSFSKGEAYDPEHTPSAVKGWPEFVRQLPDVRRTYDPMFSVAAIGSRADELTKDVPMASFAPGCFWQRFVEADGWVININLWAISGLAHYVERCLNVPYRYDKLFVGDFILNGKTVRKGSIFTVQDLTNPDTRVDVTQFDALAYESGLAKKIQVGRGFITAMRARDMVRLLEGALSTHPNFLNQAGLHGRVPVLTSKKRHFNVTLPADPSMQDMIEALWFLPRDIVSDGYDAALDALSTVLPMQIHAYPTGTHAWTWLVPEKWTCYEAWLETVDGRRLVDYADNPLHAVSYSLPFEGLVSREVLLKHLHSHPCLPDATPFVFKYYERDWGLCCPSTLRDSLNEAEYRVCIRSEFSFGELKVGEVFVQGQTNDCIVLCAHLCHPAQVADDLSGVVVGMEVMRELKKRPRLRYSYRFLILPETIGSLAWLSQNEHLIPQMKGGLFLEMLSLSNPPALQMSFDGDTMVDRCFAKALSQHAPDGWTGAFRTIVGNDERQFNAPGVRVPMLSLSRVLKDKFAGIYAYAEYHSSEDTPSKVSWPHMVDSTKLVLHMIETLEASSSTQIPLAAIPVKGNQPSSRVPINHFKGEIFCSRYGLHLDFAIDPERHRAFFNILYLIDGINSVAEIAQRCNTSEKAVEETLKVLAQHGLVS